MKHLKSCMDSNSGLFSILADILIFCFTQKKKKKKKSQASKLSTPRMKKREQFRVEKQIISSDCKCRIEGKKV